MAAFQHCTNLTKKSKIVTFWKLSGLLGWDGFGAGKWLELNLWTSQSGITFKCPLSLSLPLSAWKINVDLIIYPNSLVSRISLKDLAFSHQNRLSIKFGKISGEKKCSWQYFRLTVFAWPRTSDWIFSGILKNTLLLSSWTIVTINLAFNCGSSKHGNALLA